MHPLLRFLLKCLSRWEFWALMLVGFTGVMLYWFRGYLQKRLFELAGEFAR